jgi:hypothetical protein
LYGKLTVAQVFCVNATIFFNIVVSGRKAIPDPDGDELAGDKEARKHAKLVAREMMARRIWYRRGLEHWAFVVTDDAGCVSAPNIWTPIGGQASRRFTRCTRYVAGHAYADYFEC